MLVSKTIAAAVAIFTASVVCRYTVRDIGFVDLHGPRSELVVVGGTEETAALEVAATREKLERLVNVSVRAVDPEVQPTHPAATAVAVAGATIGSGVRFVFVTEESPPLVLTSTKLLDAAAAVRSSPVRDRVAREALTTFAHVLVFEGADVAENRRLDGMIDGAERALAALESQLPRPIDVPLRRVVVPHAARVGESVLLAAIGVNPEDSRAAVAILYGRGKRAGPVLVGEDAKLAEVVAQLALVGESCECDTDRDWINEPNVPLSFDDPRRESLAGGLGFEPASPLVKAEVVRILGRGRLDGAVRDGRDGVEAIVFGYREAELLAQQARRDEAPSDAGPTSFSVAEGGDGDWGFDEPAAPAAPVAPVAPVERKETTAAGDDSSDVDPVWWTMGGFLLVCLLASLVVIGRGSSR